MAEHYCNEHQVVFFKKGKMKGYAHPIQDEAGEATGEWCNEPETKLPLSKPDEMSKEDWATKDKIERDSIEAQVAFKGVIELAASGKLEMNCTEVLTAKSWGMSKLSNWSSQGEPVKEETSDEPQATDTEIKKLTAARKTTSYSDDLLLSIMTRKYNKTSIKALTGEEIAELTKLVAEGYMQKNEEIAGGGIGRR